MRVRRYFIEEVAEGQPAAIHGHAGTWHGVWLDSNTLFGVLEGSAARIDKLEEEGHPTITIMPSLADPQNVHQHLKGKGKHKHSEVLKTHDVPHDATMHTTAVHLARKLKHPFLKPHF